ncbi:hypothetical protein KZ483_23245 [Paenibacillus sp. sptzw28]|uniref:hypothetical protein n=1 Tax=Paenibacillus sp. sptzw28 TaxID=715179 RepID=UPI001C6E6B26|nr:hypothetical protein [Paenibacillus sp. sptzw28]QYR20672.1 hypothetical protein KZ483_23245 [Paenibacillus sp. sptzw28]
MSHIRKKRDTGLHRLCVDDRGAVSVFLIVATAGILLLTSLLIDYARVAAFQKQLEIAAQSGIRSALSAYDGQLYERYGLFGAGGSDRNSLFAHAARNNWEDNISSFNLLRVKYGSSHVNSYEVLGTHSVFKRQVLEEMKYKAPIDFTLEVASRFAPVASAMKEASASIQVMEQVRKLYDQREARLQAVLDLQNESARVADEGLRSFLSAGGSSVVNIMLGYGAYLGWIAHDSFLDKDEKPKYTNEISSYENSARSISSGLRAKSREVLARHRQAETKALKDLEEAERYNSDIREAAERMEQQQTGSGYDRMNKQRLAGKAAASTTSNDLSQLQQAREAVQQLILPAEWFIAYREELNAQAVEIASLDSKAANFQTNVTTALSNHGSSALLVNAAVQLQSGFGEYSQKYIQPATVISARTAELESRQSADAERKKKEKAAQSKWNEVRKWIQGISSIPQLEIHRQMFEQVSERSAANLQFNDLSASGQSMDEPAADPNESAQSSMSSMGTIFSGMADMLEGIRDPLYINEYIAHRFAAFDPKKFSAVMQDSNKREFSEALSLNNQEVEYILYGFNDPAANIAAAYGEVFSVRLAIRTMEGLIESRALGHPLLVLAAAVLYGLEKSMEDMFQLVRQGTTPLSKYVSVDLTYLDYLRVFLLLHGSDEHRISRIIAVIEQNTGMKLSRTSTGLSGELTASVNLWFLPGLLKSFTNFGILNGKVKGGRYETTKSIGWSYE